MSSVNDSRVQARPSYGTLASGNDAVGTEDSFRLVNICCYMRHFLLLITKLKGQEIRLRKQASLADPSLPFQLIFFRISLSM